MTRQAQDSPDAEGLGVLAAGLIPPAKMAARGAARAASKTAGIASEMEQSNIDFMKRMAEQKVAHELKMAQPFIEPAGTKPGELVLPALEKLKQVMLDMAEQTKMDKRVFTENSIDELKRIRKIKN